MPGILHAAGCCCPTYEFGDSCDGGVCEDRTPATIFASIGGTFGGGCRCGTGDFKWTGAPSVANLPQVSACTWSAIVPGYSSIAYAFPDCENPFPETFGSALWRVFLLGTNRWRLLVELGLFTPFDGTSAVITRCQGATITNTGGDNTCEFNFGLDGSVSF